MSSSLTSETKKPISELARQERGILFVISSPSGGGKGTLIRRVLPLVPRLGYSVSWTTRQPRPAEQDGIHYRFVTPETFADARGRGEFLEWAIVHGNFYGTSRRTVEQELAAGRDIILEIDVQGAASVKEAQLDAVSIFIIPPSFEILRARLLARRTETAEALALRLNNSRVEIEQYHEFDYVLLNDDLERAATQLVAIMSAERARRERQEPLAQRVIETFPTASQAL